MRSRLMAPALAGALLLALFPTHEAAASEPSQRLEPAAVEAEPMVYDDSYLEEEGLVSTAGPLYLAARAGISWAGQSETGFGDVTHDIGGIVAGAIGVNLEDIIAYPGLRAELELGTTAFDADRGGRTRAIFGLASVYYDLAEIYTFTPFVGAGAGIARLEFDNVGVGAGTLDGHDTAFAGHITAGLGIELSDRATAEFGYRFFSIQNAGIATGGGAAADTDLNTHTLYAGLRFSL